MDEKIETTAEHVEGAAMRLARAVHTGDNPCHGPEDAPLPDAMAKKPVKEKSPAEWAYERLILYIKNFEEQLDSAQEIAMGLTDTGAGVLRIEGLGYFDPDIVTFYGSDMSGARIQLVQHVSQLNVVLRANPKPDEEVPARRIGFDLAKGLEEA